MGPEGLGAKTRVLDAAKTGGPEIEAMRGTWAELQNRALERAGERDRVDHRSLEVQRADALTRGDTLAAEALDRAPEVKLGPAASAMERRAMREAERDGRDYEPVTDRGRAVHEARSLRALYAELKDRVEQAREAWGQTREQGRDRIGAGLAALRAAAAKHDGPGGGRRARARGRGGRAGRRPRGGPGGDPGAAQGPRGAVGERGAGAGLRRALRRRGGPGGAEPRQEAQGRAGAGAAPGRLARGGPEEPGPGEGHGEGEGAARARGALRA